MEYRYRLGLVEQFQFLKHSGIDNLKFSKNGNPNANKKAPAIPPTDRYTKPASPMKIPAKIDLIIKSLFIFCNCLCGEGG